MIKPVKKWGGVKVEKFKKNVEFLLKNKIFKPLNFVDILDIDDTLNYKEVLLDLFRLDFNKIEFLVKYKMLDSNSFEYVFIKRKAPEYISMLYNIDIETLYSLFNLGILNSFNVITSGINALEHEMVLHQLIRGNTRYFDDRKYPIEGAHPLLNFTRSTADVSSQIVQVIGTEFSPEMSIMKEIRKIFESYLSKSKKFNDIKKNTDSNPNLEKDRIANIELVNRYQKIKTKKTFDQSKRYIDIYARYTHGEMDPFMLAIITMAVDVYVYGGHSKLFSNVRIVPYKEQAFPWIAYASSVKSEPKYNLRGESFRQSNLGANRIYLTHSDSTESSSLFSIPIVTNTTFKNAEKIGATHLGVVNLSATFDNKDPLSRAFEETIGVSVKNTDRSNNILQLIDETFRAIQECEERQILAAKYN